MRERTRTLALVGATIVMGEFLEEEAVGFLGREGAKIPMPRMFPRNHHRMVPLVGYLPRPAVLITRPPCMVVVAQALLAKTRHIAPLEILQKVILIPSHAVVMMNMALPLAAKTTPPSMDALVRVITGGEVMIGVMPPRFRSLTGAARAFINLRRDRMQVSIPQVLMAASGGRPMPIMRGWMIPNTLAQYQRKMHLILAGGSDPGMVLAKIPPCMANMVAVRNQVGTLAEDPVQVL
jgi:hypothetical protein